MILLGRLKKSQPHINALANQTRSHVILSLSRVSFFHYNKFDLITSFKSCQAAKLIDSTDPKNKSSDLMS